MYSEEASLLGSYGRRRANSPRSSQPLSIRSPSPDRSDISVLPRLTVPRTTHPPVLPECNKQNGDHRDYKSTRQKQSTARSEALEGCRASLGLSLHREKRAWLWCA